MSGTRPHWVKPRVIQLVINCSIGDNAQKLNTTRLKLTEFFEFEPTPIVAKSTVKKFDLRRGRLMGYKYEFRGRKAADVFKRVASTLKLGDKSIREGMANWGVPEYSMINDYRYAPMIPNFGMTFHAIFALPGHRVAYRARGRYRVGHSPSNGEIYAYIKSMAS